MCDKKNGIHAAKNTIPEDIAISMQEEINFCHRQFINWTADVLENSHHY
jgi:hypothetical protein